MHAPTFMEVVYLMTLVMPAASAKKYCTVMASIMLTVSCIVITDTDLQCSSDKRMVCSSDVMRIADTNTCRVALKRGEAVSRELNKTYGDDKKMSKQEKEER